MRDYSEGYLELRRHLDALWKATLTHDWQKATECCLSIQTLATGTAIQLNRMATKKRGE